ncbi:hypothetical protein L0337_28425, partial [candidate division KSB1 bacterium]|nr:hypothetical protein [candidate division KSB1 bacterium]
MRNAHFVRPRQPFCSLYGNVDDLIQLHRPGFYFLLQSRAITVSHDNKHPAVLGLVNFIDRADVGMIERRSNSGFVDEVFLPFLIRAQQSLRQQRPAGWVSESNPRGIETVLELFYKNGAR